MKEIFDLFKKGYEVANPAAVKAGQTNTNALVTMAMAFLSLFAAFGYDFKISQETIIAIVTGFSAIWAFINAVLTVISSKRAGF